MPGGDRAEERYVVGLFELRLASGGPVASLALTAPSGWLEWIIWMLRAVSDHLSCGLEILRVLVGDRGDPCVQVDP